MKIGLLADEPAVGDAFTRMLASGARHHVCEIFSGGTKLKRYLRQETIDMLIVDRPISADSLNLLRWTKERSPDLPVVVVMEHPRPDDIIAAFRSGADEFIAKPLQPDILSARIEALDRLMFRRSRDRSTEVYGDFRFELSADTLYFENRPVDLTGKEFGLALIFFRNQGRTLSRSYLYEMVWEKDFVPATRSLDVHVSRLRRKACLDAAHGWRLSPVYTHGYRLVRAVS